MATIIDGKKISAQVKDECRERLEREGLDITLAVIQVGDDPASTVYSCPFRPIWTRIR